MDFPAVVARLDGGAEQAEPVDELVAAGRAAVADLVAGLRRAGSPAGRGAIVDVLRRIGPPAYPALIDALALAEDAQATELYCRALGITPDADIAQHAHSIRSEDPDDRASVAFYLGYMSKIEYAPLLVPLLADSVDEVRHKAVEAFGYLGRRAVPLLRRVRRSAVPERLGALTALAQIGWDTPEPRDLAILARFLRAGIVRDIPEPVFPHGEWYAIETSDQTAVMEELELSDPVPIPWSMGTRVTQPPSNLHHYAYNGDRLYHSAGGGRQHWYCAQLYVSPALDGWTFVFGQPVSQLDLSDHDRGFSEDENGGEDGHQRLRSRCAVLSRRFGRALWFGQDFESGCGDWKGWCIAEHGEVLRYYNTGETEGVTLGPEHPAESGLLFAGIGSWLRDNGFDDFMWDWTLMRDPVLAELPHTDDSLQRARDERLRQLWLEFQLKTGIPDTADPMRIASRICPDLTALGPNTQVRGHGVMALTACGRRLGHRGALT